MQSASRTTWECGTRSGRGLARGFTLMEVLVSLGIIFLLLGLLLTTFKYVNRSANEVQARTTLQSIRMAISQFETDFGFAPPLVRDGAEASSGSTNRPWPEYTSGTTIIEQDPDDRAVRRIMVCDPEGNENDLLFLRAKLPRYPFPATADNPFKDFRFSNRTLAYYLVGALEVARNPSLAGTAGQLPIDGVKGAGFYHPEEDGAFEIPPRVLRGSTRGYKGRRFTPFVDVSRGGLQLVTDPDSPRYNGVAEGVELQDNRFGKVMRLSRQSPELVGPAEVTGRPIRYYRWEPGRIPRVVGGVRVDEYSNPTIDLSSTTNKYADLNIPRMVGEDPTATYLAGTVIPKNRDIEQNSALRSARWAIVHAGKDGFFGDEEILTLRANAGFSAGLDDVQLRRKVMEDNIVEVGQ